MRTLLIFIALALIYTVGKRLWSAKQTRPRRQHAIEDKMVQCAHCGIYVPLQEAVSGDRKHYCSSAHRDADSH